MLESNVGTFAKSYGQAPQPTKPAETIDNLRASTTKYLSQAHQKLLTTDQQDKLSKSGLLALYNDYLMRFLRSPAGHPFRRTLNRRILTIVLGSPYSELHPNVHAITALTTLAQASITEDPYGTVSKDVPLLIRAFVSTIVTVENFTRNLQPHWTDVRFSEQERRVQEVEIVVGRLKGGLGDVLAAFEEYVGELGMGREEVRSAREVAGLDGD